MDEQMKLEMPDLVEQYSRADPTMIDAILKHYRMTGFPHIKMDILEKMDELRTLRDVRTETI